MKAGRELDALIAIRIMGWKHYGTNAHHGTDIWIEPDHHMVGGSGTFHEYHWSPSHDIRDAWKVVDRMHELGFFWWFASSPARPSVVHAHVRRHEDRETVGNGYATDSTPHSICLAALEALGVKT